MADEITFTEQLTPYLPVIGIILGGMIVGAFAVWNRRRGNVETKAPSVSEIWARADRLEKPARWAYRIQDAFREYVARVLAGGSTEMTATERAAHDVDLDNASKEKTS